MHPDISPIPAKQNNYPLKAQSVRCEALCKFPDLIADLDGSLNQVLLELGLPVDFFNRMGETLPYRIFLRLLQCAAQQLECSDFGLRLATLQGGGGKVMGPIEVVMKNSQTILDAFAYCSNNIRVYSPVTQFPLEEYPLKNRLLARFEILLEDLPDHQQAVEHAIMATHLLALDISHQRTYSKEVWFTHPPISPKSVYRNHFGCTVRFNQRLNGVFFGLDGMSMDMINPDQQVYEMATSYIEARFPPLAISLKHQMRLLITHSLDSGYCTEDVIADKLGICSRTLQRRLKKENTSFEEIKDNIRKDIALRCLKREDIPFGKIAEALGYSELSVFSRSCRRWFSKSPRKLRTELLAEQAKAE